MGGLGIFSIKMGGLGIFSSKMGGLGIFSSKVGGLGILHRQYEILLLIIVLSLVNNASVKDVIKRKKGEQIRLLDKDWASGLVNGIKYNSFIDTDLIHKTATCRE